MKTKQILILGIVFLMSINTFSQSIPSNFDKNDMPAGEIIGSLKDAQTGQSIEYGNIVLFSYKDSSMVSGTVSGKDELFSLSDIPFGNHFLRASLLAI